LLNSACQPPICRQADSKDRRRLLDAVNHGIDAADRSHRLERYDRQTQQAFDMLRSARAGHAFDLEREPATMRDGYGRSPFVQSVSAVAGGWSRRACRLVQVNWYRGARTSRATIRAGIRTPTSRSLLSANVLAPPIGSGLERRSIDDLSQRGILDETLVVCLAEFGRTHALQQPERPRPLGPGLQRGAGQGAGIRGGVVHGAQRLGKAPSRRTVRVRPEDLTATILHCLGQRRTLRFATPSIGPSRSAAADHSAEFWREWPKAWLCGARLSSLAPPNRTLTKARFR